MNTYTSLKISTSICTMSHESAADQNKYDRVLAEQAQMVDCGLVTFDEAKRAIYQA